jgi:hypothetical protein
VSKRNSKTTPEALAAQGLVEWSPGRWCHPSDFRAAHLAPMPGPEPDAITVTIACRTVSEANSHQHWRERQRRAKEQRRLAFTTVPACVRNMAPPLRITLTRLAPRRLDSDNLAGSMKAVRDGVADAIGIDDGDQRLDWQYGQRKSSEYGVEIVIQRVEG